MEIRRFGVGHRRQDGPPGTHGVDATPLHGDARGAVAELALKAHAAIAAHSNPNLSYFVVIEGGGFVQVGDERARVAAGEAVVWPPNVVHAAWTESTPMRAIVVEFADAPALTEALSPEGGPGATSAQASAQATPAPTRETSQSATVAGEAAPSAAEGRLAPKTVEIPEDRQSPEGEPW